MKFKVESNFLQSDNENENESEIKFSLKQK